MKHLCSGTFCLILSMALLVGALRLCPELARALNLDLWELPTLIKTIETAEQENAALEREEQVTMERLAIKDAVAHDVIAGRLTLHEAAARFQELQATAPKRQRRVLTVVLEGNTDEERYSRMVMLYVETWLRGNPEMARAVQQRLERELSEPPSALPLAGMDVTRRQRR